MECYSLLQKDKRADLNYSWQTRTCDLPKVSDSNFRNSEKPPSTQTFVSVCFVGIWWFSLFFFILKGSIMSWKDKKK